MKRRIACSIMPGQFDSEQVAVFKSFEGNDLSLFAPLESIDFTGCPTFENPISGRMTVEFVSQQGDLALIRLPAEVPSLGYFATVLAGALLPDRPTPEATT